MKRRTYPRVGARTRLHAKWNKGRICARCRRPITSGTFLSIDIQNDHMRGHDNVVNLHEGCDDSLSDKDLINLVIRNPAP